MHLGLLKILYCFLYCTWRLSVDPVPTDAVVEFTNVSSNPNRSVLYQAVRVTNYELLKHVVNILISNDRQRRVSSRTKLSRFIPIQQRTIRVETMVLIVHFVASRHLDSVCEGARNITCTKSSKIRIYTVGHKKRGTLLLSISSPIIDQFLNFFYWRTPQTIYNNTIIIYFTTL